MENYNHYHYYHYNYHVFYFYNHYIQYKPPLSQHGKRKTNKKKKRTSFLLFLFLFHSLSLFHLFQSLYISFYSIHSCSSMLAFIRFCLHFVPPICSCSSLLAEAPFCPSLFTCIALLLLSVHPYSLLSIHLCSLLVPILFCSSLLTLLASPRPCSAMLALPHSSAPARLMSRPQPQHKREGTARRALSLLMCRPATRRPAPNAPYWEVKGGKGEGAG